MSSAFGGLTSPLTHRVAVYVPGTCNVNRPASQLQQQWTDIMLESFSTLFGGGTAVHVHGCYVSASGVPIQEPVNLVFAYCDSAAYASGATAVIDLARSMCRDMGQECVAIEADGVLYFVSQE